MEKKHPTFGNGKICYMEIPATDIEQSSNFYQKAFGWHIRKDETGNASFDDAVHEVSGMWVLDRQPATRGGVMISIMVDSIPETRDAIVANGGKMVTESSAGYERTALFSDPAGNVMSLYESRH